MSVLWRPIGGEPNIPVFITTVLSHVAMIPTFVILYRRCWIFEFAVIMMGYVTSIMYHFCQSMGDGSTIFLSEGQWHRIDNIAALTLFGVYFSYLCNFRSPWVDISIKYFLFMISIVLQQKDPWNINYTLGPIACYGTLPFLYHGLVLRRLPQYDWKNFVFGFSLLGLSFFFFLLGLDDANDPYRSFHGLWHFVGGCASYFLWSIVRHPLILSALVDPTSVKAAMQVGTPATEKYQKN